MVKASFSRKKTVKQRVTVLEKKNLSLYKWLKQIFPRLDRIEEKLKNIENFLGGEENIKRVLGDIEKHKSEDR